MAFLEWLKSLVRRKPPLRNIAGIAGTDPAQVEEVVEGSVGPLRPNHRRLSLRDKRLQPKHRPNNLNVWVRPKKPKYFTAEEAKRWFSTTMRTRNRKVRDLMTDFDQLRRYGLPEWNTEEDIAKALEITLSEFRHYSIHRNRDTVSHYVTFAKRKRNGGQRLISAPKRKLKALHRKLLEQLVQKLPVSRFAHGFLPGKSVASNARPHVGKRIVIKLDLADCFPSIHYGRVRGLLIALGYSYPVATALSVVMTEAPRQKVVIGDKLFHVPVGPRVCVQGAPTSPGICNAVLLRLDRRLAGIAKKFGYDFTRYADDITFSGNDDTKVKRLVSVVRRIIRMEGFCVNDAKTRVLRRGGRQRVTGVIVNQTMGLSRVERRRLRAAIHQLKDGNEIARQQIEGKVAYLKMLNAEQAKPLQIALSKTR